MSSPNDDAWPAGDNRPVWEDTDHKVRVVDDARAVVAASQQQGQQVVFTNGCFDILHQGHLQILREARKLGDFLVVGVNSDESIRDLKGPRRPIFGEADRMGMLAAFPFVDLVVLFAEATPLKLIETLRPDVLVKGADYKVNEVVGGDFVRSLGGRVELIELVPDRSTTAALKKLEP